MFLYWIRTWYFWKNIFGTTFQLLYEPFKLILWVHLPMFKCQTIYLLFISEDLIQNLWSFFLNIPILSFHYLSRLSFLYFFAGFSSLNPQFAFFHFVEFPVTSFIFRSDAFMRMLTFALGQLLICISRESLMPKFHFQIILEFWHKAWKLVKRLDLMAGNVDELACEFWEWGNTICCGVRNS